MSGSSIAKCTLIEELLPENLIYTGLKTRGRVINYPLQSAFQLLADFKSGCITYHIKINSEQICLLRILCEDLLSDQDFVMEDLNSIILKIMHADSLWNKRCQLAIGDFYFMRQSGRTNEAREIKKKFIEACPLFMVS